MKHGRIVHIVFLLLVALYLGCNMLMHSDKVSGIATKYVASQVRKHLGGDISLGDIKIIRPMGLNIDNVILRTPDNDTLATLSSATVRMKVLPLLKGHLSISGMRLLNPDIRLRRDSVTGQANYQFILDLLSKDGKDKTGNIPYISVNSVILKNGRIRYDDAGKPDTPGLVNGDHLDFRDINANISLKALSEDTLNLHIRSLGFEEKSGFGIRNLESKLVMSEAGTQVSGFRLNIHESNVMIPDLYIDGKPGSLTHGSHNISLPHFDSRIAPSDFAAFIPALSEFNDNFILTLSASGRTDSIQIDNLRIRTSGNVMSARMDGAILNMEDNPGLQNVNLQLSTAEGLHSWLSGNLSGFGIELPDIVHKIEKTDINVAANGNARDNDVSLFVKSGNAGTVTASLITEDGIHRINLESKSVNIGSLTGIKDLGNASLRLAADNIQYDSTVQKGRVRLSAPFIEYKGYRYSDIELNLDSDGKTYSLSLDMADRNATVNARVRHYKADESSAISINVDNFDLAATNIYSKDSISEISGIITAEIEGTDIDRMRGSISIDTLTYWNSNGRTDIGKTVLSVMDMSDGGIISSLGNDIINATIYGRYKLSTILASFKRAVNSVSPELYMYINSGKRYTMTGAGNSFDAYLSIKQNDLPQRILNIPLSIDDMVTLHAGMDDASNESALTIDAPSVLYRTNRISGFNLSASGNDDTTSVSMKGIYQPEKGNPATIYGFISGSDNLLKTLFSWKDNGSDVPKGNILADVVIGAYNRKTKDIRVMLDIHNADFNINGRNWHTENTSIVSDSGHYSVDNLILSNDLQSVRVDGTISADTSHTLSVIFDDICLDDITALLDKKNGKPIMSGNASGSIKACAILDKPIVYGNIKTGAISLMGSDIDSLRAVADWRRDRQEVDLKMDILCDDAYHTMVQGVYVPKHDSIDINVRANHLDMYFLNGVIPKNTINEIRTALSANLRIYGNLKRLDFLGNAFIEDTYVNVTPNDVAYYVPEAVMVLKPGLFSFRDMDTYDMYGNFGIVDLDIRHTHLKRFMVNLDLQSNGIEVFNIPEKEYSQVFGRIFAGGTPRLSTQPGFVYITGNCMTAPGTWLDIKSGVSNASNYSFLTIKDSSISLEDFYDIKEREVVSRQVKKKEKSVLDINLNAELNDNAVIYAQMNSVNGSIRGSGNVSFKYDTHNGVNMSGIYNIKRGDCVLSLQQILRKEFTILDDSRVTFNGGLENTNLDIHTSHTVNSVSMYDLDAKASSSSRVKARCLMDVTGTVSSPQFTFDVDAPQASVEDRDLISSATSTEEQRNMQFMYLLTLGRFYTYDYSNAASLTANPVSAMQSLLNSTINGQINNLLSYVLNSNYVSLSSNLNTSYLSSDPTSFVDDTFEGILEAHLLNNRLILNGNFGYRKDNLNQTSSVIGDFELKWLLFPKTGISLLGYNRNNQRYYTKTTLYTQGFGVAYGNDFNSFFRKDSQKSEAVGNRRKRRKQ